YDASFNIMRPPGTPFRFLLSGVIAACTFVTVGNAQAQKPHEQPANSAQANTGDSTRFPAPPAVEKTSVTQQTTHIGGQEIHYTATAGTLLLKKEYGKPKASMFFIAYSRDGTADPAKRPITFAYNGGPGSSSVWLHMGALGPKRVPLTDEGFPVPPPYPIVDNEDSVLDFTDLVFIDPVTTGYSRNAPGENPQQFHGLEGDLSSVAAFIQEYLSKYNRWSSPKFLAGESYGTTRSAGLSDYLL